MNLSALEEIKFYKELCMQNNNFTLEKLQYTAIDSFISAETLEYHHGKHHQGYLNNLNKLKDTFNQATNDSQKNHFIHDFYLKSLKGLERFKDLEVAKICQEVYNNSAQCLNHSFYWQSISSVAMTPSAKVLNHFVNYEDFVDKFLAKSSHFGSSWAWLVCDKDFRVFFHSTSNASNPLELNLFPLLVCDIWEHAYYVDYRNQRLEYMKKFLNVINWNFVETNLDSAKKFFNAV